MKFAIAALAASVLLCGCSARPATVPPAPGFDRGDELAARVPQLLRRHRAAGAAVAVIRDYRVVFAGYYGEQGPGVPASSATLFNTASLAKTITTEIVLRLASAGKLALDESIAQVYADPELAADPRYRRLTPRIILSHRSGLLNWPYLYDDGKLAFVAEPGEAFGYSGAAFEILGAYLEKKTGMDFESLARRYVFAPEGMKGVAMSGQPWADPFLTTPMNGEGIYEKPYRSSDKNRVRKTAWSAADDLYVTLEDYAKFLVGTMRGDGKSAAIAADQLKLESSFAGAREWQCEKQPARPDFDCPDRYGFGLGWMVFEYGDTKFIQAGGNDSGENALVYFSPQKNGDAIIVFVNGGNGIFVTLDVIDLLDPQQPLTAYYHQLIDRHQQG